MSQRALVLYLHVHQPFRLRHYSVLDITKASNYFSLGNSEKSDNDAIVKKIAKKSYLPTNKVLLKLLRDIPEFKLSLSLTGTVLEQFEMYAPEVLKSFQELVATGKVDILAETYHHSLAFFYDKLEFQRQVSLHEQKINRLFGVKPTVFRNTELAYNNELAMWADSAGYKAILAEGWDPILGWRSPNYAYKPVQTSNIKLLMKNYKLSDDIAFRFGNKHWEHWPLSSEKFVHWATSVEPEAQLLNLFMDYETFGEHQWSDSGIFDFLEAMPKEWLKAGNNTFMTASEAAGSFSATSEIDVHETLTWADTERDLSAWVGNSMQTSAISSLYALGEKVLKSADPRLVDDWRKLQTSDHFYYMCTKWFNDGDIHAYFSPYSSPYEAFINFQNALHDMKYRLNRLGEV